MNNHFKSRALIVSCAVVALVAVSVAEIPHADRYEARNAALRSIARRELNTSADGGIVINYSSDETSIP